MNWKRCKKCNTLMRIDNFYKIEEDKYFSKCKKCIKEENKEKKEIKKEYDKKRYLEKKKKKKNEKIICMRCNKYYVNVKNNELYWCFHCLEKYENELNQKIKVEIIDKTIKKVD